MWRPLNGRLAGRRTVAETGVMFDGFATHEVQGIHLRIGGSGPPVEMLVRVISRESCYAWRETVKLVLWEVRGNIHGGYYLSRPMGKIFALKM